MFPVALDSLNTIDRKRIPVIFFPGVMGSRLRFTASETLWDPDSKWTSLKDHILTSTSSQRDNMHFREPAEILESDPAIPLNETEADRGWAGLYSEHYVPFLRWLSQELQGPFDLPCYAVPYDWRQDIGRLAAYAAGKVEEILEDADVASCSFILVSHSMGGLVTRRMLQHFGALSKRCLAAIHVVQPVDGAAVLYRRFFSGNVSGLDGHGARGAVLARMLGNTATKVRQLASALPGVMQLLPSPRYYSQFQPKPWLTFSTAKEVGVMKEWTASVHDLYRAEVAPPGLAPEAEEGDDDAKALRSEMIERVAEVEAFHSKLDAYRHPRTYAIYSTGIEGDSHVHFRLDEDPPHGSWKKIASAASKAETVGRVGSGGEVRTKWSGLIITRTHDTDGTVPEASGASLFRKPTPHEASSSGDVAKPNARQFVVHGVPHDEACSHQHIGVANLILRLVHRSLREAF